MFAPRPALFPLVLLVAGMLAACDSGDPVDEPSAEDVIGTYRFERLAFDPAADESVLPTYSLLDTLVAQETYLRLLGDGDYVLFYQFQGGSVRVVRGRFTVRRSTVRLATSEGDQQTVRNILLDADMTFTRNDPAQTTKLTATLPKTVDLKQYSRRYAGIPPVEGRLIVTLARD